MKKKANTRPLFVRECFRASSPSLSSPASLCRSRSSWQTPAIRGLLLALGSVWLLQHQNKRAALTWKAMSRCLFAASRSDLRSSISVRNLRFSARDTEYIWQSNHLKQDPHLSRLTLLNSGFLTPPCPDEGLRLLVLSLCLAPALLPLPPASCTKNIIIVQTLIINCFMRSKENIGIGTLLWAECSLNYQQRWDVCFQYDLLSGKFDRLDGLDQSWGCSPGNIAWASRC